MTKRAKEQLLPIPIPTIASYQRVGYSDNELCEHTPHNQPDWVQYMDNLELSCVPGLNDSGGYITFRTGKNTQIDTNQACSLITTDLKDQKACIKKLNSGILPGLDGENGEATIYLNNHGSISFREDGLFADAPEYETMMVVNAIASANYTQREPDMTTIKLRNTIKENPIITDLSMGVLAIAVIGTVVGISISKAKEVIARRNRKKPYLSPIPIDLKMISGQPMGAGNYDKKSPDNDSNSLSILSKLRGQLISLGKYPTDKAFPRKKASDPQNPKGLEEKQRLSRIAAEAAKKLSQFDAYKD